MDSYLKRLAWRELALRFLDGYNPEPLRHIIICECILSYYGELSDEYPLRYHAHHFVKIAHEVIELKTDPKPEEGNIAKWIRAWNSMLGEDGTFSTH